MPPGVATASAPSVRTSVGSIADRLTARQSSAAIACASQSVTYVNAFSQSPWAPLGRRVLAVRLTYSHTLYNKCVLSRTSPGHSSITTTRIERWIPVTYG
jgi:hypothetical protein